MDTRSAERVGTAADGTTAAQLVRTAAGLRWTRPDLTATLAELALDGAADAAAWIEAAGWLLHGRAAVGDGRATAGELLDGLRRWGDAGAALMIGPIGRRLRVELAGAARHIGEPDAVRLLLAADDAAGECHPELHADTLTALARSAVEAAPDSADDALLAAERAWQAADCGPGVGAVLLLDAARHRAAGRPDLATSRATSGLARVGDAAGRQGATGADHVVAALTAEWITTLVVAGRLDEARRDALTAANRLLAAARPSRQAAGLRLAVARAVVGQDAQAATAAAEQAVRDAVDSDAPDLESACRLLVAELHEAGGQLGAALGAVRAALAAERRDRERAAQLRGRLAAVLTTWGAQPSRAAARRHTSPSAAPSAAPEWTDAGQVPQAVDGTARSTGGDPGDAPWWSSTGHDVDLEGAATGSGDAHLTSGGLFGEEAPARQDHGDRNGRHRSEQAVPAGDGPGSAVGDAPSTTSRVAAPDRSAAPGWATGDGSLIGDALFEELTAAAAGHAEPVGRPDAPSPSVRDERSALDAGTVRWETGPGWDERPSSLGDTVVLPAAEPAGPPWHRPGTRGPADHGGDLFADTGDPGLRTGPDDGAPGAGQRRRPARHGGVAETMRYDRAHGEPDRRGHVRRAGPPPTDREAGRPENADGHGGDPHPPGPARRHGAPPGAASSTGGTLPPSTLPPSTPPPSTPPRTPPAGPEARHVDGGGTRPPRPAPPPAPGYAAPSVGPAADAGTPGAAPPDGRPNGGPAPGRPSSTDPDGLSLGDLLAGALAAYRDM